MPVNLNLSETAWQPNLDTTRQAVPTLEYQSTVTLPGGNRRLLDALPSQLWLPEGTAYHQPPQPTSYLGLIGEIDTQELSVIATLYEQFLADFFAEFQATWPHATLGFIANLEGALSQRALYLAIARPDIATTALQTGHADTEPSNHEGQWLASYIKKLNRQAKPQHVLSEQTQATSPEEPAARLHHRKRNNLLRLIAALSGSLFVCHIENDTDPTLLAILIARQANRPVFFHDTLMLAGVQKYLVSLGCHPVGEPTQMISILEHLRQKKRQP